MNEKELRQKIKDQAAILTVSIQQAEQAYTRTIEEIKANGEIRLKDTEQNYQKLLTENKKIFDETISCLSDNLLKQEENYRLAELPLDSQVWKEWKPGEKVVIPSNIRVGELTYLGKYSKLIISAIVPMIGSGKNILIEADGEGKRTARQLLQSIVFRLMALLPPAKANLICIDPVGPGATTAGFLKYLPSSITGGTVWFESQQIEQQLAEIENQMSVIKTKYLGIKYPNLEMYNLESGEIKEPYRLLVVSDFPERFSDSAARRLVSIATNGPAVGVYVIAMLDRALELPHQFNIASLESVCNLFRIDNNRAIWDTADFRECQLRLDAPPQTAEFIQFLQLIGSKAEEAGAAKLNFGPSLIDEHMWWTGNASTGVEFPIGKSGSEIQKMKLDNALLSAALIIGRTGSGKSTLLHVIIHTLAFLYSPDELEFYLLDLKLVEFNEYADWHLPHARVVAINTDRDFALSVLEKLQVELTQRQEKCRDAGVNNLSDYSKKTGLPMPRVIILIDEFQRLFENDDTMAREASQIIDTLVRQGRAFGMNLILASQTLRGYNLPGPTRDQILLRIALQSSDLDARMVLSDENGEAGKLKQPGEAIYNNENGQITGNKRFNIYWLDQSQRRKHLVQLNELTASKMSTKSQNMIIFDGEEKIHFQSNQALMQLLERPNGGSDKISTIRAWLGEPISIKPSIAATFQRSSGSNLLLLGQDKNKQVLPMFTSIVISLYSQLAPQDAEFYVINFTDDEEGVFQTPDVFTGIMPHKFELIDIEKDVEKTVSELWQKVSLRSSLSRAERKKAPSIFLLINGLQSVKRLRWPSNYYDNGNDGDEIPLSVRLLRILQDGPEYGFHTIVWCDTLSNLTRSLDRNALDAFDMRVVSLMNPDDSQNIIGDESASRLQPNRCLFVDKENNVLEKFRPYSHLSVYELRDIGLGLKKRYVEGGV